MANLLGYKPKKLSWVVFKMPGKYKQFSIPKKSGGVRTISAPAPELKLLQRRLAAGLEECWSQIELEHKIRRPISHGFRKGASIATNAAVHRRRRYVFNVDIADFFGSITFGRVWRYFEKNKDFALPTDIAKLIAQIACGDQKRLPQGSPCSPVISNLIGQILDVRLATLAKKHGCSYSRYADDLTFSTNKKVFPKSIRKLPRRVDSSKLDFSGRILPEGESDEEIEIQRVADRCHPQGGRGWGGGRADPA